jgi:hypothetical protein
MKPRLESAPYTREDYIIWWCVTRTFWCQPGHGFLVELEPAARRSDRRDAEIMFYAQQFKLVTWIDPDIDVRNSVAAYWADPPWGVAVMKRRQPIAPLTKEDHHIWYGLQPRWWQNPILAAKARMCDVRDADLMLSLTNMTEYERSIREEFGAHIPGPAATGFVNSRL